MSNTNAARSRFMERFLTAEERSSYFRMLAAKSAARRARDSRARLDADRAAYMESSPAKIVVHFQDGSTLTYHTEDGHVCVGWPE